MNGWGEIGPRRGRGCQTSGMSKLNPKRKRTPKAVLRLPDLEQSKSAVLNSLAPQSSRRSCDHAIREFIEWYCSEPRLAFNKTVVTRYRIFLEQAHYASSTINLRRAAVRRLACEAADGGLLSPDLAAGIRRVKGAKKFGVRMGNWLTAEQGKRVLGVFDRNALPGNTRLRHGRCAVGLRIAPRGSGRIRCSGSTATRRTLGVRRSRRQGLSCSDRSSPTLDSRRTPNLDYGGEKSPMGRSSARSTKRGGLPRVVSVPKSSGAL